MTVDPAIAPYLPPAGDLPPITDYDATRRAVRDAVDTLVLEVAEPGPEVAEARDVELAVPGGSVRLRIYRPLGPGPRPVHLFVHGGGWVLGSIDDRTTDLTCRERAALAGHTVIAVGYRKAPEHPFPTAVEDVQAALAWAAAHRAELDGNGVLTVGGGSAGANIAAALALKNRDEGGPELALQLLEVPALDLTYSQPSHRLFGTGYALSTQEMANARAAYLPRVEDRTHPYASPLLAPDLSGLPPAVIVAAELDILRDDAVAYAHRLAEHGVPVRASVQLGQVHSSSVFTRVSPAAREWRRIVIEALRTATA